MSFLNKEAFTPLISHATPSEVRGQWLLSYPVLHTTELRNSVFPLREKRGGEGLRWGGWGRRGRRAGVPEGPLGHVGGVGWASGRGVSLSLPADNVILSVRHLYSFVRAVTTKHSTRGGLTPRKHAASQVRRLTWRFHWARTGLWGAWSPQGVRASSFLFPAPSPAQLLQHEDSRKTHQPQQDVVAISKGIITEPFPGELPGQLGVIVTGALEGTPAVAAAGL